MIGPLALVIGLLGLWALARGKAGPVLDAILNQSGFSTSLDNSLGNLSLAPNTSASAGSASSSSTAGTSSNSTVDSGSHQGLVDGLIVTIDKGYGQMTDAEKSAANDYAHKIGNVNV